MSVIEGNNDAMTIRILSLDDEPEMGKLIKLILERMGYDLVFSSDSREAWELLHTEPFDLLMQDLMRPDIDGWEFYLMIKSDVALHTMPVIINTAKAQSVDKALGYRLTEIDAYITKPFGPQELLAALEFVLRKHGKVPPGREMWRPYLQQPRKEKIGDLASSIKALRGKNRRKRALAAETLGASGDPQAVEPLIQALRDYARSDYETTCKAVYALGSIGDERAIEPLIEVLQDGDAHLSVRGITARVLAELGGKRVMEPLVAALRGGVGTAAIIALGQIGDPRAVEPLIEELQKGEYASNTAAWVLGDLGDARAVEPLIKELNSKSESTVWTATRSLARIGAQAVEPLIAKVEGTWYCAPRKAAIEALGQTKDRRAVEPLIAVLQDDYADVRRTAAWYLGYLQDTRAVQPLITTLQKEMANRSSVTPLLETLRLQKENAVACTVIRSLGHLEDEAAVEPLIAALQDESADIVWQAADALGKIGNARAIPHLKRAAREDTRTTQYGGAVAKMVQYAIEQIEAAQ